MASPAASPEIAHEVTHMASPSVQRPVGPSSISAPVSPSSSFANLGALRFSLAMQSGLDMSESAHTFPVNDGPSTSESAAAGPSAPPSRPSSRASHAGLPSSSSQRQRREDGRRSRPMSGISAFSSVTDLGQPPLPPPLSMRNLPAPRASSRRTSPFPEHRGMSFTPAASPPASSPVLAAQEFDFSDAFSATERRRRSLSGSSNWPGHRATQSGTSSPTERRLPQLNSSQVSRPPTRRTRSRASSDASGSNTPSRLPPVRQEADSAAAAQGTAPPIFRRRRTTSSSSSNNLLRPSNRPLTGPGFDESEASDPGAEGDAEQDRPPYLHVRSRSSPHIAGAHGLSAPIPAASVSHLHRSRRGTGLTPHDLTQASSGSAGTQTGYFGLSHSSHGTPNGDASLSSLWHLQQAAAFGFSAVAAAAGLGIGIESQTDTEAQMDDQPPPPYQPNDEQHQLALAHIADLARGLSQNQAPHEVPTPQGHGLTSPDFDRALDDDALAFRTRGSIQRERSISRSRAPEGHAVPEASASANEVFGPDSVPLSTSFPQDSQPRRGSHPSPPLLSRQEILPSWQPKSDTEGDTDATDSRRGSSSIRRRSSGSGFSARIRTIRWPARSRITLDGFTEGPQALVSATRKIVAADEADDDAGLSPLVLRWLIHPLRLLAAVPGCVGTFWLIRNAFLHFHSSGSFAFRESLEGSPHMDIASAHIGAWRKTCGLDFLLAALWALSTAYHALSLTTLLLRRWLVYYALLPSLIRLLALQAICWPLVRLTIYVAGPDRPIEAWIVIASTTAFSDVVARWVTSNIADAPTMGSASRRLNRGLHRPRTSGAITRKASGSSRARSVDRASQAAGGGAAATGDEVASLGLQSEASRDGHSSTSSRSERRRRSGGQRFWRAVMGAPIDSSTSDSSSDELDGAEGEGESNRLISSSALEDIGRSGMTNILTRRIRRFKAEARIRQRQRREAAEQAAEEEEEEEEGRLGATDTAADTDADFDLYNDQEGDGGETTDAGATTTALLDEDDFDLDGESAEEALHRLRSALIRRRRRRRMRAKMAALSSSTSLGPAFYLFSTRATETAAGGSSAGVGPMSSGGGVNGSAVNGGHHHHSRPRIKSRRVFHWEVAMKRNVAPLGILAYLTLWGLLLVGQ